MKKIVILGNSIAGVKAAQWLRSHQADLEIDFFSFEPEYPYRQDLFCDFIQKKISAEEILFQPKKFYPEQKMNFIMDKVFNRVNFNKRKIFTEDKQQIDYEALIITDCPKYKFPDIKGANKEGVFSVRRLVDIQTSATLISVNETLAIEAQNFSGLQMALAFSHYKKEILLVVPSGSFLSALFSSQYQEWLFKIFEENGVTVIMNNRIFEILGDTDVKAIRLESGKIYSSQLVLFDTVTPDLRAYEDERLKMDEVLQVNGHFETSIPNVFALGDIANKDGRSLEEQGNLLGAHLTGKSYALENKVFERHIQTEKISVVMLGDIDRQGDLVAREEFNEEKNQYKKMFFKQDALVGAFLVNADDEKEEFLKLIGQQK